MTLISPDAVATPMLERQVGYPEAALTFAGGRALTVEEVERAIFEDALPRRPMEIVLSGAPGRGMMARLAGLLPGPAAVFGPRLIALGRRRQEEVRRREPERRGASSQENDQKDN